MLHALKLKKKHALKCISYNKQMLIILKAFVSHHIKVYLTQK